MLVKRYDDIHDPEIWERADNEDIIVTKPGTNEQRVLINWDTYQKYKQVLYWLQKQISHESKTDSDIDWEEELPTLNDILNNSTFKKATAGYFINRVRSMPSSD